MPSTASKLPWSEAFREYQSAISAHEGECIDESGVRARDATVGQAPVNATPPTVAFVVHEMRVGGAELMVQTLVRALEHEIRPVVLCLDAVGPLGEQLRDSGVPVMCGERRPGIDLACGRRLGTFCRELGVNVVHAQQYTAFFYSTIARATTRAHFPIILTEHGRVPRSAVSTRRRLANRGVLARQAAAITACSDFSRRGLIDDEGFRNQPIELVRNGVELPPNFSKRPDARQKEAVGLDATRRYALVAARLDPVKDHATLFRAWRELPARLRDVVLLVAGEGPTRTALQALADELGIASRVKWLGTRSDVVQLIQAAEVTVLASRSEAAPFAVLEAMAAARPVVATAVGGVPEMVADGVEGLLVPSGDVTSLANALTEVLDSAALAQRLGMAGRERVREQHQLDDMVTRYRDLYLSVLAAQKGAR